LRVQQKSISSVVAGKLVLESTEESSLCFLLLTVLINDPFLIFEELAVLNEGLVNIGLSVGTSSTVSVVVGINMSASVDMGSGVSMSSSVGVAISVRMAVGRSRVGVRFGVGSVSVTTFADDVGLLDDFGNDGLGVSGLNDGLFVNFITNFSVFLMFLVDVSLVHNGDVLLFNEGGVFLVDHRLVMLMDVLLNHDWLMMLVNNVLMMLMNYILLVLYNNIFVMLVDDILMNLLNDGCISVLSVLLCQFVSFNGLAFIGALVDGLFVVSDHNGFLVDLLNVLVAMAHMVLTGLIVASISVGVLLLAAEASLVVAAVLVAVLLVAGKTVGLVVAIVTVSVLLLADE